MQVLTGTLVPREPDSVSRSGMGVRQQAGHSDPLSVPRILSSQMQRIRASVTCRIPILLKLTVSRQMSLFQRRRFPNSIKSVAAATPVPLFAVCA